MELVHVAETSIVATFKGVDKVFEGSLGDLGDWTRTNNAGIPTRCTSEGLRHGLFPVIMATDERLSGALSLLRGYDVPVGDGASYYSKAKLLEDYRVLVRAGIQVPSDALKWMVTNIPYPEEAPKAPAAQVEDRIPF